MGNALRMDELWEPTAIDAGAASHLETNKWLAPVISTSRPIAPSVEEQVKIPFLGQTILWTRDRDRPFPGWVREALVQLLFFAELSAGWDSYGGKPLQRPAVGPVLQLLMRIHQAGRQADLVPLPDGGVGLRLSHQGRSLEIDVAADGGIEAMLEGDGVDGISIGPGAEFPDTEQLLGQFVAP